MSKIWMRAGDPDDYEEFDNPYDAGYKLGAYFEAVRAKSVPGVTPFGQYGVEVGDSFVGPYNYVSLYWGDDDGQPDRATSKADIAQFKTGLSDGMNLPARRSKSKTTRKSRSKSRGVGGNAVDTVSVGEIKG